MLDVFGLPVLPLEALHERVVDGLEHGVFAHRLPEEERAHHVGHGAHEALLGIDRAPLAAAVLRPALLLDLVEHLAEPQADRVLEDTAPEAQLVQHLLREPARAGPAILNIWE